MNTTPKRLFKALVSGALFALVAPAVAPITGQIKLVSPREISAAHVLVNK